MAENLKKYTDSIRKTIEELNASTVSTDTKIKKLVTVLSAVNQGLIKGESKIKGALEGIGQGKFESEAVLRSYLKTLQLVEADSEKIVENWKEIKNKTVDELKRTKDYSKIITKLGEDFDDMLDLTKDITDESKKILNVDIERSDLVTDLVKKYNQFHRSIQDSGVSLKNINIDLTKGSKIVDNFLDLSDTVIPNLFDSDSFNFDDLKKYSSDIASLSKAWANGDSGVQMQDSEVKVDIDQANSTINDFIKTIKPQIEEEYKLKNKKLSDYYLASKGFEGDLNAGILRDLKTQQQVSDYSFKVNKDNLQTRITLLTDVASQLENIDNMSQDQLSKLQQSISLLSDEEKLLVGQAASYGKLLTTHDKLLSKTEAQVELYGMMSSKLEKFQGQIDQLSDSIQETFSVIPYSLQRLMGIDKIASHIAESFNAGLKSYVGTIAQGQTKLEASANAMKAFGAEFSAILGPIGLIAAGLALVFSLAKKFEGELSEISKNLQVSRRTAEEIHHGVLDILTSSENRFATEEQILEIQKDQLDRYGQILDLSSQTNKDLIQTAVNASQAFGIMTTDAMELMQTFKSIGANDELSKTLLADIGYMAEAANMSPGMISKDLIDSAKELSLYFAGMPKQAVKAAIQIRRLGLSIKQAGQIADKMLNIEGFMSDMAELSAMTNGKINFSDAFDLRMKGDIEGMTKSIMDNIGTLEDFNSMGELAQRKLASTLGMEVNDLKKSVKLREMQNSLGEDQTKILMANLDKVGDIENMNLQNMKTKAEELNSMNRLSTAWDKIKAVLYKSIVPIIETISETLSSSTGIIDLIGLAFKGVGLVIKGLSPIIKGLSPIIKGFFLPFKWIGDVIEMVTAQLERWFEPTHKAETTMAGVGSELLSISGIIKGLGTLIGATFSSNFLLKKLTGINVLGKIFDTIKGKAAESGDTIASELTKPSLFKMIIDKFKSLNPFKSLQEKASSTDLVQPIVDKVEDKKGILGKLLDKINPFKSLQEKAKDVDLTKTITESAGKTGVDLTKTITETATKQLTNTTTDINNPTVDTTAVEKSSSIFNKITDMIKKGVDIIKKGFSTLKDFIISAADMVSQVLQKLGTGIGKFFESVLEGIGNGLSKFTPNALIGAGALLGIASALWVTGKALQQFNTVDWSSLVKGGAALVGLGAAAAGLGMLSEFIIPGAVAIAALSGALWVLGKAVNSVGDGLTQMLISISTVDVNQLLLMGPALLGVAAGLAAISAGSILQGITSLFSVDPFEKLGKIATLADPMQIVANSIKMLVDNLTQLGIILSSLDLGKLDSIGKSTIEISKSVQVQPLSSKSAFGDNANQTSIVPILDTPSLQSNYNTSTDQNSVVENNYNSKPAQISTAKLERLVSDMNDFLQMVLTRPSVAVITDEGAKGFNNKLKGLNNK